MSQHRDASSAYTPRDYLHGQLGRSEEEAGLAVVAYARVSHEESAESGLSIPQQLDNIRAFCQQKGWEVIAEFKDEGASAYRESEDRPAFRQMIEFCLASQHTATPVRYIVVDKFDRFSRDDYVNAFYKHTLLPSHGIQVISVAEPFDTSSVGGWLAQRVIEIASVARSMEDAYATMRAMIRNAAEGHSCGGKCPWGYKRELVEVGKDPKGQPITRTEWVPDPKLVEHVVELFERLANGDSLASIARDFTHAGIPSPSGKSYWTKTTVYDLARRVYVYEGTRVWNMVKKRTVRLPNGRTIRRFELKDPRLWIRVENAYPRIIPPELARRVRERFPLQYDSPERYYRQQARKPRRDTTREPADGVAARARNSDWVLTGLAICGYCGGRLVGYKHNRKRKDGTVWRAYRCGTYVRSGKAACRSYYIPAERLEAAVLEALRVAFEQGVTKEYANRVARALRRAALKRLRQLEQRLARIEDEIVQAVQQGIRNELDRDACNMLIGRLKAEAQQLLVERSVGEQFIEALEGAGDRLEELIREGLSLVADWPEMSPQEKATALREVVDSVVVFPEEKMAIVYLKKVLPELPKEAVVKISDRGNAQKSSGSGEGNVNQTNGSGGAYPLVCLTFEVVEVNWATGEVQVA